MNIKVKKLNENAVIPEYQTPGSAGFDLKSCENFIILPGKVSAVDTGLAYEIPEGYELQIRSRSGLAVKKNIFILNSPGTIDSDFRGSVKCIICNASNQNFSIGIGDRIAQGVINKVERGVFNLSEELSETERNTGEFGSTGIN